MQRPPVLDLVLAGLALAVTAVEATFITTYGWAWPYVANVVIHLVLTGALAVRRTMLRTSFVATYAALAALALVVHLSPLNIGVTPLLFCALLSLWTITRWWPSPRWGMVALALAIVGSFGSPVVRQLGNLTVMVHVLLCVFVYLWAASLARSEVRHTLDAERRSAEAARVAASEERARIARELHDIVAHSLTVVQVQANTGLAIGTPDAVRTALEHTRDASREALTEVRSLVGVLRSDDREPTGDLTTLPHLLRQARENGVRLSAHLPDADVLREWQASWPAAVRLAVLRTAQEGLTNVVKHAGPAPEASLSLTADAAAVRLHVDNALPRATRPDQDAVPHAPGHGLLGLRERAAGVRGALSAEPMGDRFVVALAIPLTPIPLTPTDPPSGIVRTFDDTIADRATKSPHDSPIGVAQIPGEQP